MIHPDDFFVNQIDLDPIAAVHLIQELAKDLKAPPRTPADIAKGLEARGLACNVFAVLEPEYTYRIPRFHDCRWS